MTPAFQGEVQLLNWSETHNGGAKIVLQLADAADLEAFKVMTVRKGKVAGQRLATVMVEIGDDEQPIEPATPTQRPGMLCVMACTFCADPAFREWITFETGFGMQTTEEQAKNFILEVCKIESRKNLDSDDIAANRFHKRIREPFLKWKSA